MFFRHIYLLGIALGMMSLNFGCAHTSETAGRDTLTENVGKYPPGPSGVNRPRVGVPPFKVTTNDWSGGGNNLDDLAADEMTTLLDQTDRFAVIERAQLQKLINEQQLEGIVRSGELAKQGQVRGVDYLLLGKITNLRVKREQTSNNLGFAQLGGIVGGANVKKTNVNIKTDCGVDIRLVNPTTGEMLMTSFSEYTRTDSADSMGGSILGTEADSNADIQLSDDDKGKILRLALDDAVRKSLKKIDKFLRNQPAVDATPAPAPAAVAPAPAPAVVPIPAPAPAPAPITPDASVTPTPAPATPAPAAGQTKFCPNCGAPNVIDAKFCAKCGHKLD